MVKTTRENGHVAHPPLGPYTLSILWIVASLVLAAFPLAPTLFGQGMMKDYPLWYAVGRQVLTGGDLHALDGSREFAFLYPPFAALLFAPLSLFGGAFLVTGIVFISLASWWVAVRLSDRLSGEIGAKPWWIAALPSFLSLPVIFDNFALGQPNILLLALMLSGLTLLQSGRQISAGALFALAAALKAFPVAIFPYLLWRRRWGAALAMPIWLAVFLVLAPAPFRGLDRNFQETQAWFEGMIWTTSEQGFGQRSLQNWSWQNNSLIAVTHRLLRPVNAEQIDPRAKPLYVNVIDLSYQNANIALAAIATILGICFCAALPPEQNRTRRSDGAEFALLLLLMTIASPLARAYYFVWLLFPLTVLVYGAAFDPSASARRLTWLLLAIAVIVFAVSPLSGHAHWPQALGNWFWATMIISGSLVWRIRRDIHQTALSRLSEGPPDHQRQGLTSYQSGPAEQC